TRRSAELRAAVARAEPDAVVDLLTAIPPAVDPRRLARDMAPTNRLRTEGLANLVAAARGARFVVESLAYAYRPGGGLADEDRPLWTDGPGSSVPSPPPWSSTSGWRGRPARACCVSATSTVRAPRSRATARSSPRWRRARCRSWATAGRSSRSRTCTTR